MRHTKPGPSAEPLCYIITTQRTTAIQRHFFLTKTMQVNEFWPRPITFKWNMLRKITSCCSTVSEWPQRSCHLPYKVENIDRTPDISSILQSDYFSFQPVLLLPSSCSSCLPVVFADNLCLLYSSASVHKVLWFLYVRYLVSS